MDTEEKHQLYLEYQHYISWCVKMFLKRYRRYKYLKDDLTQECSLRFMTILDKYDPSVSELTTFLYSQLSFYMRNYIYAERGYQDAIEEFKGHQLEFDETYRNPHDISEFNRMCEAVYLSEIERQRLLLKVVFGYSCEEIASQEGISRQAVDKCINKSLEILKDNLFG